MSHRPSTAVTLLTGILAGAVATVAKGKAEAVLQPRAERIWPPSHGEKAGVIGADPADHPANMPPAVVVERGAALAGQHPSDDANSQGSEAVHWGMGVGSGVAYALLAARVPAVRAGFGVPAGLALYAGTHGSALPLLGVQRFPRQMPTAAVAWEAGSHVVYAQLPRPLCGSSTWCVGLARRSYRPSLPTPSGHCAALRASVRGGKTRGRPGPGVG